MRPRPGQWERSLTDMTVGVEQGRQRRGRTRSDTHSGPWTQRLQVPVSGRAGRDWSHVDHTVSWELPFVYNPLLWLVPFRTPHFHADTEVLSDGGLVIFHTQLRDWVRSDQDWFTGAVVRFAAHAPNSVSPVAFTALGHLTFQGYAAATDGDLIT